MTLKEAGIVAGRRVRMLPTTQYAESKGNPRNCHGTVVEVYGEDGCRVQWDNGSLDGGYCGTDVGKVEHNCLPPKFYIKRDRENSNFINDWFTENTGKKRTYSNAYLYYPFFNDSCHSNAQRMGYVELTFEEFKRAVNPINDSYSIF